MKVYVDKIDIIKTVNSVVQRTMGRNPMLMPSHLEEIDLHVHFKLLGYDGDIEEGCIEEMRVNLELLMNKKQIKHSKELEFKESL